MPVVAGIDEAGYGPTLGPLVVTATAFESSRLTNVADLWDSLGRSVSKEASRSDPRLLVSDSKKAYSRAAGLKRLEETTLSFLSAGGWPVESLTQLMSLVCPTHDRVRATYPWYTDSHLPLPVEMAREDLVGKSQLLAASLQSAGVRFCGAQSRVVCPAEFNASVRRTGNKAVTLFEQVAGLLHSLWDRHAAQGLTVFVDKQGGRDKYLPQLAPEFFGKAIRVHKEGLDHSLYEIRHGDSRMEVHFVVEGDQKHFPTALASMYSKYLRELDLRLFNRYWQREAPSLRETAGYPTDAERFLMDIEPARRRLGVDPDLMVRQK